VPSDHFRHALGKGYKVLCLLSYDDGRVQPGDAIPTIDAGTQTVCERLNDVWVRGRSASYRFIIKRHFSDKVQLLPIQFVQVSTNLWYSHTYSFVTL
jgi:hypothetical protein